MSLLRHSLLLFSILELETEGRRDLKRNTPTKYHEKPYLKTNGVFPVCETHFSFSLAQSVGHCLAFRCDFLTAGSS